MNIAKMDIKLNMVIIQKIRKINLKIILKIDVNEN